MQTNLSIHLAMGMLTILGTYLLSKSVFEDSLMRLVNFIGKFSKLPLLIKSAIILFIDKDKFENGQYWNKESFPSEGNFTYQEKFRILTPFIGFVFICLAIILDYVTRLEEMDPETKKTIARVCWHSTFF